MMIMNGNVSRISTVPVVAHFMVLSRHSPGQTGNQKHNSVRAVLTLIDIQNGYLPKTRPHQFP
jgi:hypothetical protein